MSEAELGWDVSVDVGMCRVYRTTLEKPEYS